MREHPDRRAFLKQAVAGAGSILGATLVPAVGSAKQGKWYQYDGFTDSEAAILSRAVGIVADRIGDADTIANTYAIAKKSWTDDDYDTAIGLPDGANWNRACMQYQMRYYLAARVPHFHLRPVYGKSPYWAFAGWGSTNTVGTVLTHDITNKTGIIKGEFAVSINRYWLGAAGDGSDPSAWAGILAHEMMHNLGHKHGPDEYGFHLQINAVQAAVKFSGKYRAGLRCPPWR